VETILQFIPDDPKWRVVLGILALLLPIGLWDLVAWWRPRQTSVAGSQEDSLEIPMSEDPREIAVTSQVRDYLRPGRVFLQLHMDVKGRPHSAQLVQEGTWSVIQTWNVSLSATGNDISRIAAELDSHKPDDPHLGECLRITWRHFLPTKNDSKSCEHAA
jgi:hypothetical protein